MGKPILCAGNRCTTPYFFDKVMVNLYSVEELCYCLMQDAYIIDQDIMSENLVEWIRNECGLTELANNLTTVIRQKGSASAFVELILEYCSFYDQEHINEVLQLIRDNAHLSQYEKSKAKADYFLDRKKYQVAITKYLELLETIPQSEKKVLAAIHFNLGNCYAGLFQFKLAAGAYRQSYQLDNQEDAVIRYLLSIRMYTSQEEYLNFALEHPELQQVAGKVEKLVGQYAGAFETTEQYRMLFTLKVCREEGSDMAGNAAPYYEEVEKHSKRLKRAYREMVTGNGLV